ncbi:MAG: hypothetical protein WDN27_02230 [Candidatus Saccharibacteria bacterium]
MLLTIIIIAAAAYGAYWYGTRKANQDNPPAASQSSQKQPTKSAASTPAVTATPTKHYDSTNFTLGIDYPETWTVTDTPAKLTVVSPNLSFTSVNGTSAEGHVVEPFRTSRRLSPVIRQAVRWPCWRRLSSHTSSPLSCSGPRPI